MANYGFEGTLYVIEPDATALEVLLAKYKKILPAAHLIGIAKPLHEAKEILRDVHIDALLANHPLDDMVVANTLDSKEFVNLFEVEYGGEEVHT
ncbi:hypothetical protein KA013_03435 [Patescibacteria group bacterium]|nr:hypothetical protein [Patescibacteria group bacterium]